MVKKQIIKAYVLKNAVEHNGKAVVESVIPGLFNHGLKKQKIKETLPEIKEIVQDINRFNIDEQKKQFEKVKDLIGHRVVREGLQELENVGKNGVVMRFSPSASGPFHIGHALTASLSYLYFLKYGGKFYVRIEDTNPENSYKDSYGLIKQDSKWLFQDKAEIVIQSERIDIYYMYIETLLKKNAAYVCTCSSEEFKNNFALKQKACHCRSLDVQENLDRWKKMLGISKDKFEQGEAVVRFKSDMKHKNIAMRDFPLARINETPHPLQKNKYRVWPLMNLAVAVDDMEMKMTHIIRAKDHRDNAIRQEMIFKVFNKPYPNVYFLGRIHFKDMELSTTKMRLEIQAGKYRGWDDVALPTIQSLKRRGYKPEAFYKFAEQIGLKEVDKIMDKKEFFLLLGNFNKKSK